MRSFATILVPLSLPLLAFAAHGVNHARHHADLALRPREFTGIRMTWYDITTGITACGGSYQPSDYVVAISQLNYKGGSLCGKQIQITYNGKSAGATIVDECMGCPNEGLDLTEDLFSYLAGGLGAGVISADWSLGGAAPAPAPAPAPTTTHTPPAPSPTPHYDPPSPTPQTTSSSSPPPPSPTTSKTSTSVSSAPPTTTSQHTSSKDSTTKTSSTASNPAQPSGPVTADGQTQAIGSLFQAIIGMGGVVS